jgi:hypothetical protein
MSDRPCDHSCDLDERPEVQRVTNLAAAAMAKPHDADALAALHHLDEISAAPRRFPALCIVRKFQLAARRTEPPFAPRS